MKKKVLTPEEIQKREDAALLTLAVSMANKSDQAILKILTSWQATLDQSIIVLQHVARLRKGE